MAVIGVTRTDEEGSTHLHTWTGLQNGTTGFAVKIPGAPDRTVQVLGTFGAGGSVQLEGSMDASNWVVLTDLLDADLIFTSAGMEVVAEAPLWIRPFVTAGDGTTSLTVHMLSRGS